MKLEFVGGRLRVKDDVAKVCGKHKKGKKTADKKGQENRCQGFSCPFSKGFQKGARKPVGKKTPKKLLRNQCDETVPYLHSPRCARGVDKINFSD